MKTQNTSNFFYKGTSIVLAILVVLIAILILVFYKGQIYVGFIAKDAFDINITEENTNAFNLLRSNKKFNTEYLFFKDIAEDPSILNKYKIIWIHRIDTIQFGDLEANQSILAAFKKYVNKGGKLLLTMEAMKYLNLMDIEKQPLTIQYANAIDDGYGRKLGLHSFQGHPVFNKLHGGAYIFNPLEDKRCRQIGFFNDQNPENGKVIAVDWSYINLREKSKLAFEYDYGRGKIIAIGAYVYLSEANRNKKHLETLLKNTFNYLLDPSYGKEPITYWESKTYKILPFTLNLGSPRIPKPYFWNIDEKTMSLTPKENGNSYSEVAGQRILVMGKENGGIEEIWAHPFMALRDFECGIQLPGYDSIIWLNSLQPHVEIRPEALVRTYSLKNITLKEVTAVDVIEPVAVIHYEYQGIDELKLFTKFKSNLRQMWPYSEECSGNIYYSYNEKSNSLIWKSDRFDSFAIVGSNRKPTNHYIGSLPDSPWDKMEAKPLEADTFLLSGYLSYSLRTNEALDLVVAAGNEQDVFKDYQYAIEDPYSIYSNTLKYYKNFLNTQLSIVSPNKEFNEGYRWALIGTDRFYANTPNLGQSFLAGYSTTAHGWDGGHKVNGRPGYAWYFGRDAEWSSYAVLGYGDFDKVKSVLETFQNFQDPNGKIYHELTTSGFAHYDAADATPLYIVLAGRYLKQTGDLSFISDSWLNIKKAIDYCYSTDTDHDKLIENTNVGHGWVEGGWLYGAHTTLYLAASWASALYEASYIANSLGYFKEADLYRNDADAVVKIINGEFWNQSNGFYNYGKMKDGTFNPEVTIMASIPMLFDLSDTSKANQIVPRFAKNGFTSDWGTRIVEESHKLFNPRGYHTGSVWPLYTGWTSLAEYQYGYPLQGFTHLMNNLLNYKHFSLGYVDEVLNGLEYKPGGVCNHQCWSETMVLQPAIEGMLGLKFDALNNALTLAPSLPYNWDSLEVDNIKCGSKILSFKMKREKNKTTWTFVNNGGKQIINFKTTFPAGTNITGTFINGKKTLPSIVDDFKSTTANLELSISNLLTLVFEHQGGVAVIPLVPEPEPLSSSNGFRIVDSKLIDGIFEVTVEGRQSSHNTLQIIYPKGDIKSVENGKIIQVEGDNIYIKIDFEESKEKYVTKKIKIMI